MVPITSHDYNNLNSPPYCGKIPSEIPLNRIVALEGVTKNKCFGCIQIENPLQVGNRIFAWVVDKKESSGLDLCTDAFISLFGIDSGKFQVYWKWVDNSLCYTNK